MSTVYQKIEACYDQFNAAAPNYLEFAKTPCFLMGAAATNLIFGVILITYGVWTWKRGRFFKIYSFNNFKFFILILFRV